MIERIGWSLLIVLVAIAGVAAMVWANHVGYWFPENRSQHGHTLDHLFTVFLLTTGAVFVVTQLLLAAAVYRFSEARPRVWYTHGNARLEWTWTFTFGVVLTVLVVYQMESWAAAKIDRPNIPPLAEVIGRQFNWDIRYPGPDNRLHTYDDVVHTDGVLHVPVGEEVLLLLRSTDVIHSFFIPSLRVKQDIVPGLDQAVWFKVQQEGACQIVCAELCGWGHARMQGRLIMESRANFERFLATAYAESQQVSTSVEEASP